MSSYPYSFCHPASRTPAALGDALHRRAFAVADGLDASAGAEHRDGAGGPTDGTGRSAGPRTVWWDPAHVAPGPMDWSSRRRVSPL